MKRSSEEYINNDSQINNINRTFDKIHDTICLNFDELKLKHHYNYHNKYFYSSNGHIEKVKKFDKTKI